jgi:hypothetical protein
MHFLIIWNHSLGIAGDSSIDVFFRASGELVVSLKKNVSTIERGTVRNQLVSRRRVARRFVGGREILRTCVLEFLN